MPSLLVDAPLGVGEDALKLRHLGLGLLPRLETPAHPVKVPVPGTSSLHADHEPPELLSMVLELLLRRSGHNLRYAGRLGSYARDETAEVADDEVLRRTP